MIVTVNTDASFSPTHNVASFAFWIVSDMGRICHSGPIRKKVKRPEVAEFQCIINAIHVLGKINYTNISKVIINTDCLNVIHLANRNTKEVSKYGLSSWGSSLVVIFDLKLREFNISRRKIEFRHVRSHKDTDSKRTWVNEWCDIEAKKWLSKMISERK